MRSQKSSKTEVVNTRKIRARRRRRALHRMLSGTLAFLCAAGFSAYFTGPDTDYAATVPAEYTEEEITAYVQNRLLNVPSKNLSRIPVFAHRGFVEDSLYNSFASFDLALLSGCPQIELDVRSSSDGILYVTHDESLSSIADTSWNVSEHSSEELDGILMKNGEKLHRLSEVLERYRDQMIYLVELKDEDPDPQPFLDVVKAHPELAENIQVQSFYAPVLENIHEALPNMFVQYLLNDTGQVNLAMHYDWPDSLAIDQGVISLEMIQAVHENGKEVWVWTVDDLEKVHRYLYWGADGVITDLESAAAIYTEYTTGSGS